MVDIVKRPFRQFPWFRTMVVDILLLGSVFLVQEVHLSEAPVNQHILLQCISNHGFFFDLYREVLNFHLYILKKRKIPKQQLPMSNVHSAISKNLPDQRKLINLGGYATGPIFVRINLINIIVSMVCGLTLVTIVLFLVHLSIPIFRFLLNFFKVFDKDG